MWLAINGVMVWILNTMKKWTNFQPPLQHPSKTKKPPINRELFVDPQGFEPSKRSFSNHKYILSNQTIYTPSVSGFFYDIDH